MEQDKYINDSINFNDVFNILTKYNIKIEKRNMRSGKISERPISARLVMCTLFGETEAEIIQHYFTSRESDNKVLKEIKEKIQTDSKYISELKNKCNELANAIEKSLGQDKKEVYEELYKFCEENHKFMSICNTDELYWGYVEKSRTEGKIDKDYVYIKNSYDSGNYGEFLYFIFKHCIECYQQNIHKNIAKSLYQEALTLVNTNSTKMKLVLLSSQYGNDDATLMYANYLFQTCKEERNEDEILEIANAIFEKDINKKFKNFNDLKSVLMVKMGEDVTIKDANGMENKCLELAYYIVYSMIHSKKNFIPAYYVLREFLLENEWTVKILDESGTEKDILQIVATLEEEIEKEYIIPSDKFLDGEHYKIDNINIETLSNFIVTYMNSVGISIDIKNFLSEIFGGIIIKKKSRKEKEWKIIEKIRQAMIEKRKINIFSADLDENFVHCNIIIENLNAEQIKTLCTNIKNELINELYFRKENEYIPIISAYNSKKYDIFLQLLYKHATRLCNKNLPIHYSYSLLYAALAMKDTNPRRRFFLKSAAQIYKNPEAAQIYGDLIYEDYKKSSSIYEERLKYFLIGAEKKSESSLFEIEYLLDRYTIDVDQEKIALGLQRIKDTLDKFINYGLEKAIESNPNRVYATMGSYDESKFVIKKEFIERVQDKSKDGKVDDEELKLRIECKKYALKIAFYLADCKNFSKGYNSVGKILMHDLDLVEGREATIAESIRNYKIAAKMGNVYGVQNLSGYYRKQNIRDVEFERMLKVTVKKTKEFLACNELALLELQDVDIDIVNNKSVESIVKLLDEAIGHFRYVIDEIPNKNYSNYNYEGLIKDCCNNINKAEILKSILNMKEGSGNTEVNLADYVISSYQKMAGVANSEMYRKYAENLQKLNVIKKFS